MAHPSACEVLRFYERIAGFERAFYADIGSACGHAKEARAPGRLRNELDLFVLLPKFPGFLTLVESIAPALLARSAGELIARGTRHWQELLQVCWTDADRQLRPTCAEAALSRIFLQPYAEYLADHTQLGSLDHLFSACPLCGGMPLAGVLRQEGDGGKRSLICSLCSNEMELSAHVVSSLWRRKRRKACHLHGRPISPRANRGVRYLPLLH